MNVCQYIISVACDIMEKHKVQHCNNDNEDYLMHASVWFELFGGLFCCHNL